MNPAQIAVTQSILAGPRPRVVWKNIQRAAAASISPTVPKISGLLCVQIIINTPGTATPGTPTGFTSTSSAAADSSFPGIRIAYKFLDGSEDAAISSAATGATEMFAVSYLLAGCSRIYAPLSASQTDTGTDLTLTDPNIPSTGGHRIAIAGGLWKAAQTVSAIPSNPPFLRETLMTNSGTNFCVSCNSGNFVARLPMRNEVFAGTSSADYRSFSIIVPGA